MTALDDVLADYFEWEQQDYRQAVTGIQRGYQDVRAGPMQPMEEFFEEWAAAGVAYADTHFVSTKTWRIGQLARHRGPSGTVNDDRQNTRFHGFANSLKGPPPE